MDKTRSGELGPKPFQGATPYPPGSKPGAIKRGALFCAANASPGPYRFPASNLFWGICTPVAVCVGGGGPYPRSHSIRPFRWGSSKAAFHLQ